MIAVRTVRQILAGHGPVYSPYERAETDTSTLWTLLLTIGGGVTGNRRRARRRSSPVCCARSAASSPRCSPPPGCTRASARSRGQVLLPAGALLLLGVSPFWDFATSGLETGLEILWLGLCWLALVAWCAESPDTKRQYLVALLIGLAPLVRPEFALMEAVFAVAAWLLIRPGKRRTLLLFVTAQAFPLVTQMYPRGLLRRAGPAPGAREVRRRFAVEPRLALCRGNAKGLLRLDSVGDPARRRHRSSHEEERAEDPHHHDPAGDAGDRRSAARPLSSQGRR